MKPNRILLCAAIAALSACKIQIETPLEGGVTTTSKAIECAAGQVCSVDVSDIYFNETFIADPAEGWHFTGWKKREAGLFGGFTTPVTLNTSGFEGLEVWEDFLADPTIITYLEPVFTVDRRTDLIELADEDSQTIGGLDLEFDFFRNPAYECGLSGNYSFMVLNPANGNADDEAPLWVYLHGGGVGHFDDEGDYYGVNNQTAQTWNNEESFEKLHEVLTIRTLDNGRPIDNTLTRRIEEGYRMLVVSMCDHDLYSGLGTPYPNNPNPGAEVNGMQATMSAVDYVVANYPTTEVWAHGTSAGSTGAYNLAMSFAAEGIHLTGAVPDSAITTPNLITLDDAYSGQAGMRTPLLKSSVSTANLKTAPMSKRASTKVSMMCRCSLWAAETTPSATTAFPSFMKHWL